MRYEDVEPDEALDLALTLPQGSLLVSVLDPERSWTPEREMIADLQDTILAALGHVDVKVTRPRDVIARRKAHQKAQMTKQRIENTTWEAVD